MSMIAEGLTHLEKELLLAVRDCNRFPIGRFELHSTKESSLVSPALDNVVIERSDESMEQVKTIGSALASLEEKGLVFLDYDLKIRVVSDYDAIANSDLFAQFCQMAEDAQLHPEFLFDRAELCKGLAKITVKGERVAKSLHPRIKVKQR